MKTLVINACARAQSNTFKIYEELMKQKNFGEIELLNLYETEIGFLTDSLLMERFTGSYESKEGMLEQKLCEQFLNAENIIIVYPTWNWSVPAILKAYFDLVFISKKTFTAKGTKFIGMSKIKKAIIINSSGGPTLPKPFAYMLNVNTDRFYVKNMMKIAGVKNISTLSMGGFSFKYKTDGKFDENLFLEDCKKQVAKFVAKI